MTLNGPGGGRIEQMLVVQPEDAEGFARLVFTSRDPQGRSVFDWGRVLLRLSPGLQKAWDAGDRQATGRAEAWDEMLLVRENGASLDELRLDPGALSKIASLRFLSLPAGLR